MSLFTTSPYGNPGFRDITDKCTFSWVVAPTSITAGTLSDITDKNHTTKLEFYGTYIGSGSQAQLAITAPKTCDLFMIADIGVGAVIGGDNSAGRSVYADISVSSERLPTAWDSWMKTITNGVFSQRLRHFNFMPNCYGNSIRLIFHSDTAGDYAFEIFSVTILEMCGI